MREENFNKAFKDKETGLWKWGSNGKAVHATKEAAERFGLNVLSERLAYVRDKLDKACHNHGRI